MENSAAGAEERPGFAGIDGFVVDDEGEEGADARAQEDAQPVDVEPHEWIVADAGVGNGLTERIVALI